MFTSLLDRCTFPAPGTRVTCAVSGGADSLALMVLAIEAGCDVTAVYVDHGLRDGAARDGDVVAAAAQRFGAHFETHSINVDFDSNVEARARHARFELLPDDVLTGHTADDQAETVLINLMRGAGLDGLAGMSATRHPILQLRRHETHELCSEVNLEPVFDVTNNDMRIVRNRVRQQVIPLLNEISGRDVVPVIARQASLIREDAHLLDLFAAEIDPTDAKAVSQAQPVLGRRALRSWLRTELDDEEHPPDAAAIERVMAVARNEAKATDVIGGVRVLRTAQRLRIEQADG